MATVILDAELAKRLRAQRAEQGADRFDEVWEGTYMMAPAPNNEHQGVVNGLTAILQDVIGWPKLGNVFPGVNISDRLDDWKENYRIPDVAVFLNDTQAVDRGSYWQGGPDFAVEIVSQGDQSREKLAFYASVATRELLVIDREPWQLELYRLSTGSLNLVATNQPGGSQPIESELVGLSFALQDGDAADRPSLVVVSRSTNKSWTI